MKKVKARTVDKLAYPSEFNSWRAMQDRCKPKAANKYHGARGIKVCKRWRQNFSAFLRDMGPKPSPSHTIDRLDSDGNYTPKNCRWATYSEQRFNQRPQDDSERARRAWASPKRSHISKNRIDLLGKTFARLTVVANAGKGGSEGRRALWCCKCLCGAELLVTGKALRNGDVQSCGCLNSDLSRARAYKRPRDRFGRLLPNQGKLK